MNVIVSGDVSAQEVAAAEHELRTIDDGADGSEVEIVAQRQSLHYAADAEAAATVVLALVAVAEFLRSLHRRRAARTQRQAETDLVGEVRAKVLLAAERIGGDVSVEVEIAADARGISVSATADGAEVASLRATLQDDTTIRAELVVRRRQR